MTLLYRPLFTRRDVYRIVFLITIALVWTIPWDAYLIKRKIWTYPPSVVVGHSLFGIPLEEVFFFIIQTYTTSLLYLLLSKLSFKPVYLVGGNQLDHHAHKHLETLKFRRMLGQLLLGGLIAYGAVHVAVGGQGTYMGLILVWAGPVALALWSMAYQFLLQLPYVCTLLPIALPTLYLWVVDTLALRRGTWAIESGTKLDICLWDGLEIEEAVFFLATNLLIVFGLVTFDETVAILETFPALFPTVPELPGLPLAAKALSTSTAAYDQVRIAGIQDAVRTLKRKSRSFYLASSVFEGRLRTDLILLYSFCRVADDLVDNASSEKEAAEWISKLKTYLDLAYGRRGTPKDKDARQVQLASHISIHFPSSAWSALQLLPYQVLSPEPLYALLDGFTTDLEFSAAQASQQGEFPIKDEADLELYARRVASTVAELCLELVFHHTPSKSDISEEERKELIEAGGRMGVALQYVNIARDIKVDAKLGRVYLPTTWLREEGLEPAQLLVDMKSEDKQPALVLEKLMKRLLEEAFKVYREARPALDRLPREASKPMTVAVESYMEIGRVLREEGFNKASQNSRGRATVPKRRRIWVAWKALNSR